MDGFRAALASDHLRPLWDVMRMLAPREPNAGGQPIHWDWQSLHRHILQAGDLITAEEAERRVLVLENPDFVGEGRATSSLYAGVQMVLPGEVAPSHRHTASALRLILQGDGGYTSVDGERHMMRRGDFVVTPSGTFHEHGNLGDEPVMWLDGLDVFVVNLLNAPFGEGHPEGSQPLVRPDGYALARYGAGLLPHGHEGGRTETPFFVWPYERTREALFEVAGAGKLDPCLGVKLDYADPASGRPPIRTMTGSMQLLPAGFRGVPYRCTAGSVFAVVDGSGVAKVGGREFNLQANDIFVAPGWTWRTIEASDKEDLVLFSFSDEVLQRHLGFWREVREPNNEG